MREIPIKQVKSLIKQLLKSKEPKCVVLLTKKKDRSLTIEVDSGQSKSTDFQLTATAICPATTN